MSEAISDRARERLARSLPLVRSHQDGIIERMEVHLRAAADAPAAFGQSEVAAMLLVQLLLDQAGSLVESGTLAAGAARGEELEALGLDGRHYSRFGDALVPILRDVLGAEVPREVPGTWCDLFWAAIRQMQAQPALERA